jgi:two-component system response regulator CpxR
MNRLLVIDDDVEMCAMVKEYLQEEGFEVEVANRGDRGLTRALSGEHGLVILDIMLPGLNGLDLLRRLRTSSEVRVLLLTARGTDVDRIVGLEIGADDYLPKPFNPRELLARVRAILRRPAQKSETAGANSPPERILVGDVELDTGTRSVLRRGQPVDLTSIEFSLLQVLLRSAGLVVTREEMVKSVLGRSFSPFDRSIDVHVSNLRRKLGEVVDKQERIKSIRSVGYIYAKPTQTRRKG